MALRPEGNYTGALKEAKLGEADTGTPVMALRFDVEGRPAYVNLYMTDRTMGRDQSGDPRISQRGLDLLGWNGDDPPTFGKDTSAVPLYMKHGQKDDGSPREEWNISKGGGLAEIKPLPKDKLQRLQADWRAMGGTMKPSVQKPRETAPAAPPPAAPAAAGPPAEAPPPDANFDASTKEEAWAIWVREDKASATNATNWHAKVREVGRGKSEKQFTAADWREVAHGAIPF